MNKSNLAIAVLISVFFVSCKSEQDKLKEQIAAEEVVLKNDSTGRVEPKKATEMIKLYESFVAKFPEDTLCADYLYRASDVASHINQIQQACDFLNQIVTKYPNSYKVPDAIFMQAFLYETSLNNMAKARQNYNLFISKYPHHPLWDDANESLAHLGIPLEELVKEWEKNISDSTTTQNQIN